MSICACNLERNNSCGPKITTVQELKDYCGDPKYHTWIDETQTCIRHYSDSRNYSMSQQQCAISAPYGTRGRLAHVIHNFYPQFNAHNTKGWIGMKRLLEGVSTWVPKATIADYRSAYFIINCEF